MSEHLRHEELIDAIEHALDAARQHHLEACAECQAAISELRAVLQAAESVEVPEPSPLFWDHFSNRVRQATSLESGTAPLPWWHPTLWWRPAGIVASALAAAVLVLVLRPAPEPANTSGDIPAFVTPPDDGSWGLVIGMASELDAADVREAAKPVDGTADAMIADLSAAQRRALAQLLKAEIGDQQ